MIKDIHLFGMIFVFLFVDIVLIIVWTIMDPLRKDEMFLADKVLFFIHDNVNFYLYIKLNINRIVGEFCCI